MNKRKDFRVMKWILFPLNSAVLATIVTWFNLSIFGYQDGAPYVAIVALIALFSVVIVKYAESDNKSLARGAFVFEIFLTAALIINAAYSISVQRRMSVARMAETNQKETITEIGKLRGSRTQREALQKLDKQESAQSVFADVERVLLWLALGELALYGLASFTLFGIARLMDDSKAPADEPFPHEIDVSARNATKESRFTRTQKSDSGRQSPVSATSFDRKAARLKLLEVLRDVSFHNPGFWFKADLIEGGVTIRMCKKDHGVEVMVARTDQSNKLLLAVSRPDFRERLVDELIYQGFPLDGKEN